MAFDAKIARHSFKAKCILESFGNELFSIFFLFSLEDIKRKVLSTKICLTDLQLQSNKVKLLVGYISRCNQAHCTKMLKKEKLVRRFIHNKRSNTFICKRHTLGYQHKSMFYLMKSKLIFCIKL